VILINKEHTNQPYVRTSENWSCKNKEGTGPFVTRAIFKDRDGSTIKWCSRRYRKQQSPLNLSSDSTWWAPHSISWWIGIFFAIGSILFALGALSFYIHISGRYYDSYTFFIGSLFFTAAAFLQYLETVNTPHNLNLNVHERFKLFTWEPHRIDWWSTIIQLLGTVFFNISTWAALQFYLKIRIMDQMVWGPDAYGSICFLLASVLAWFEVNHSLWSWKPRSIPWLITVFNLVGSVSFGVSAVASYIFPSTGLARSVFITNLGIFVGGLCFFMGAVLLLPERIISKQDNQLRNLNECIYHTKTQ
jgi:hypothetical protein